MLWALVLHPTPGIVAKSVVDIISSHIYLSDSTPSYSTSNLFEPSILKSNFSEGFRNSEHPLEVAECDTFRQRGLGSGDEGLKFRVWGLVWPV